MVQYHIYPGGKRRIVTFSYDDGSENDVRLIALFNKYGVKGTFHLNSARVAANYTGQEEMLRARYAGHEVACHTVRHGWPARMPMPSVVRETYFDREALEKIFGCPVIGMSYPSGSYDDDSVAAMRACGIVYSRTTKGTNNFPLPEDFMRWHPTCHHRDALPLADQFLEQLASEWTHPLFYVWGHSHEFRTEEDWAKMEELVAKIAGHEEIWYATNLEIYEYLTAQKQLIISADETIFRNPTATDVWVERDKRDVLCIPAGAIKVFPQ